MCHTIKATTSSLLPFSSLVCHDHHHHPLERDNGYLLSSPFPSVNGDIYILILTSLFSFSHLLFLVYFYCILRVSFLRPFPSPFSFIFLANMHTQTIGN